MISERQFFSRKNCLTRPDFTTENKRQKQEYFLIDTSVLFTDSYPKLEFELEKVEWRYQGTSDAGMMRLGCDWRRASMQIKNEAIC